MSFSDTGIDDTDSNSDRLMYVPMLTSLENDREFIGKFKTKDKGQTLHFTALLSVILVQQLEMCPNYTDAPACSTSRDSNSNANNN